LGLSRNNQFHIAPENGNIVGPLLIEHLFDEGHINADKFSFYFQYPGDDSWMDLGEPHESLKKEGTEYVET